MPITTFGIGAAVTPTVVKTTLAHYTNRKPRAQKPTAHISYDQGLHLVQSFLLYASHHTVEEVQAFTGQWVPHPTWTRTENVIIPEEHVKKATELIIAELGESGVRAVGGPTWWQWRRKDFKLKAEWVEMRSDYNLRQRENRKCRRIMLYVHGGAYFFGSVDEHRYQLQRHARKLQARVFAPRYRLAPQFPFPCGLLDCLAAYMYLLTIHDPTEIIFAGDSAGGGMILSMLCILRDQQMPLPAGAILISPWVDLTHSFPSLSREDGFDYIPAHGFMQKPSRSWPPPNEDEIHEIVEAAYKDRSKKSGGPGKSEDDSTLSLKEAANIATNLQPPLSLQLDGENILVKDQVQMYTTNQLITHPLVSPVLQPSLGGLPPLLIMVGDGELLRDEQIYLAHKAANPEKYKLNDLYRSRYDPGDTILKKYAPTPVQLQVWDDLCHVTPTLSFTRPAKFMYRSVAQFGAWALSRAQKRAIEIMDDHGEDDDSSSSSSDDTPVEKARDLTNGKPTPNGLHAQVGKAGDAIPPFKNHMIREQVDRHGNIHPLPRAADLPAFQMSADMVGVVKEGPIRRWLTAKQEWDKKYQSQRRKVQRSRIAAYMEGNKFVYGDNEVPPPSALAGRLQGSEATKAQRLKKSWGLGVWSSWSWKEDERTVKRDVQYEKQEEEETKKERRSNSAPNDETHDLNSSNSPTRNKSESELKQGFAARRKTVTVQDEGQVEDQDIQSIPLPGSENSTALLAVSEPPPTIASSETRPNPEPQIFLPKWKQSAHLTSHTRDISDTGSTYSHMTTQTQDNVSTRAVFSAPGVKRQDSNLPDADDGLNPNGNTEIDTPPLAFRPSTPGPQDNLGGYDTPVSKRSVERLRNHQVDDNGVDGGAYHESASVHSSLLPIGGIAEVDGGRKDMLRSPSTMAIVHAEGVIDSIERKEKDMEQSTISAESSSTSSQKEERPAKEESNVEISGTPKQRPTLYDREASDFVTALEKL